MSDTIRIGFIGAGNVNFGGGEGPWDHASRLEKIAGVSVVGVADVDLARAEAALAARKSSPAGSLYERARAFADFRAMLDQTKPDAVFVGLPPAAHGRMQSPGDVELACASAGVHLFIEKPLAAIPPEELQPVAHALAGAQANGLVVSVGYMFRYSRAIDRMRELIAREAGGLRALIARYNCAYSQILKREWWDTVHTGGPIVEQATHFCDLARLLGGEVDLSSVKAVSIAPAAPQAKLCDVPTDSAGRRLDDGVPPHRHVPRSTAAVWRFASGAIGSLTHGTLLHEAKYESELEVWGDGLRMVLADPYGACRLLVRHPHAEETILDGQFNQDDPYRSEDEVFIDAVRRRDASAIRSSYADAFRTHQFTWAIRRAAERG